VSLPPPPSRATRGGADQNFGQRPLERVDAGSAIDDVIAGHQDVGKARARQFVVQVRTGEVLEARQRAAKETTGSPVEPATTPSLGRPGPGHELVDARGGPEVDKLGQHVGEVSLRIDAAWPRTSLPLLAQQLDINASTILCLDA
jgi:hypothetical protein